MRSFGVIVGASVVYGKDKEKCIELARANLARSFEAARGAPFEDWAVQPTEVRFLKAWDPKRPSSIDNPPDRYWIVFGKYHGTG